MKSLTKLNVVILLTVLMSASFSCTEPTSFSVDPLLRPYYDEFMKEAKSRGARLDAIDNLIMVVRPGIMDQYHGQACTIKHPGGQHYIYFDQDIFYAHPERRRVISLHELGHCYLNRSHNNGFSYMNPAIASIGGKPCLADTATCHARDKLFMSELFYHAGE
ncbi:MAG TPA: hypothetical protein VGQ59_15885 [Cyclobacteriaceae bacterium]|jgi:hypothetical protein|nr:hypothetical protein [Cyclobacteriaceae bacterium]